MAIHCVAHTLNLHGEDTEIVYYILNDEDADLSFQISIELIAIKYRTCTQSFEFADGYLTTITVFYETTPNVRVTLS